MDSITGSFGKINGHKGQLVKTARKFSEEACFDRQNSETREGIDWTGFVRQRS